MVPSFEFLAAFEGWQEDCRRDGTKVDSCPFTAEERFERFTAHATLLNTLRAYDETKNIAVNGHEKDKIAGFSGLVSRTRKCGLNGDPWKDWLQPRPDVLVNLPEGSCLLRVGVRLMTPFFSRDDRTFYPTENVLKRHHVFLTPYLAASGLKGILRWAWRMACADQDGEGLLFGRTSEMEDEDAMQGLLQTWPVFWEGKVGIDLINPQKRDSGAGSVPVKYEVVLPEATGEMIFLLVNKNDVVSRYLPKLLDAIYHLLTYGSLSAKGTVGWGQVTFARGDFCIAGIPEAGAAQIAKQTGQVTEASPWDDVIDANGELIPFDTAIFTKKCLESLGITAVKLKKKFKNDPRAAYEELKKRHAQETGARAAKESTEVAEGSDVTVKWTFSSSQQNTFFDEARKYAQEMSTWLK